MRLKEAKLPIDVVEKILKQLGFDELSEGEREEILNNEGWLRVAHISGCEPPFGHSHFKDVRSSRVTDP